MHSFRSKTHILGIFTPFRCSTTSVWFRTMYFTSKTRVSGGFTPFHCHTRPIMKIIIGFIKCTSLCLRNHFLFSHNEPNPLFQSKTHVLGGSMPFRSRTWHIAKTGIEAHLIHEFMPLEPFLVFCTIGVHLKHEFVPRKPFLVWSQRTLSIHNFRSKTHIYKICLIPHCTFT